MTYTYTCADCAEVVELTCSAAEKDKLQKSLQCSACGGSNLVRVFNAMILQRSDGSTKAAFPCGPGAAPGCCPGR